MIEAASSHPQSLYTAYMDNLLPNSIHSKEWTNAIEFLIEKPESLNQLSVEEFEAFLMTVLRNEHFDLGTTAYAILLKHPMMDEMSEKTLKEQSLEPVKGWSSHDRDRLALFLDTHFAEQIPPFRLQQIYFDFRLADRDTYRLAALIGPYNKAGVDRVLRESGSLQ